MGRLRVKSNVRKFRENQLLTQKQLARAAGVSLRTIHAVENGYNCRIDTKRKILKAFVLPFEDRELVFPAITLGIDGLQELS